MKQAGNLVDLLPADLKNQILERVRQKKVEIIQKAELGLLPAEKDIKGKVADRSPSREKNQKKSETRIGFGKAYQEVYEVKIRVYQIKTKIYRRKVCYLIKMDHMVPAMKYGAVYSMVDCCYKTKDKTNLTGKEQELS